MKYTLELSALDKAELIEALNVWLAEEIKRVKNQHLTDPAPTNNFIANKIKFINKVKEQLDDRRANRES